jgi:hypothetical protein
VIGNDGLVTTHGPIWQNTFGNSAGSNAYVGQKARGSAASPLPIVFGDLMLALVGRGYDGQIFKDAGSIVISSDGAPNTPATAISNATEYRINTVGTTDFTTFGAADNNVGTVFTANRNGTAGDGDGTAIRTAGDMPGKISFLTAPDNGAGPTERMRITRAGNVGIGTTSPNTKLHVVGDLTMQSATTATTATAGTNGALPAQVAGYLQVSINGASRKIPYYA